MKLTTPAESLGCCCVSSRPGVGTGGNGGSETFGDLGDGGGDFIVIPQLLLYNMICLYI